MEALEDKVAVVTGGASGIGRALAERFARAGMKLVLADVESEPLEATAHALRTQGVQVLSSLTDVTDGEAVEALAARTLDEFGAAHVVCNNAGVAAAGPIWEHSVADWEFVLGVNLWGVIHGVRAFAPHLLAQNEGHFVNTASMAGLLSHPGMGAYNVSKQGVVAYSETLFEDLRSAGSEVGVSVLCPAFVQTAIWDAERNRPEHLRNTPDPAQEQASAAGRQLLKAVIDHAMPPSEVAEAVHDAVCEKRLYVLTHDSTRKQIAQRADNIAAGRNPGPPNADLGSLQR